MYGRNFKPKAFTDITMPAKLLESQILAGYIQLNRFFFCINPPKKKCLASLLEYKNKYSIMNLIENIQLNIFYRWEKSVIRFKSISITLFCIVMVIALTILYGCAGIGRRLDPPEVSLAHITIQEVKAFETAFQLQVRVFNFNDVPLEIKGIDCELEINGRKLAKGISATQTKVPAFGTELVRMQVYSSMIGMVSSMLDMIRSTQSKQIERKVNYKISGRLRLGGDSRMPWSLPFKSQGELNLWEKGHGVDITHF